MSILWETRLTRCTATQCTSVVRCNVSSTALEFIYLSVQGRTRLYPRSKSFPDCHTFVYMLNNYPKSHPLHLHIAFRYLNLNQGLMVHSIPSIQLQVIGSQTFIVRKPPNCAKMPPSGPPEGLSVGGWYHFSIPPSHIHN